MKLKRVEREVEVKLGIKELRNYEIIKLVN